MFNSGLWQNGFCAFRVVFFPLANELFLAFNKTLKYRSKRKQVPSKEGEMEGVGGGIKFYLHML